MTELAEAERKCIEALREIARCGKGGQNMPKTRAGMSMMLDAMHGLAARAIGDLDAATAALTTPGTTTTTENT